MTSLPLLLPEGFQKCYKPDCFRKIKTSVRYCCTPCANADERSYEIENHSEWCDERVAERGEYTLLESSYHAQTRKEG